MTNSFRNFPTTEFEYPTQNCANFIPYYISNIPGGYQVLPHHYNTLRGIKACIFLKATFSYEACIFFMPTCFPMSLRWYFHPAFFIHFQVVLRPYFSGWSISSFICSSMFWPFFSWLPFSMRLVFRFIERCQGTRFSPFGFTFLWDTKFVSKQ